MQTRVQMPPRKIQRRSNLLIPELGIDVNEWDTIKLIFLFYIVLTPLARFLYPKSLPASNSLLFFPVASLLFLWLYQYFGFWPSLAEFGLTKDKFKGSLKSGILAGQASQAIGIGIGWLIVKVIGPSRAEWGYVPMEPPLYAWGWAVHLVSAIILGPLVEELIFRGVSFEVAKYKYGRPIAIGYTALFFAIMHGFNPVRIGQITVSGIIYVLVYEREGNLAAPVIAHGVHNLVATLLSFVVF